MSDWLQSPLNPAGPQSGNIFHLWWQFFWVSVAVYLLSMLFILLAAYRRRTRGEIPLADVAPAARRERGLAWWVGGALALTVAILFGLLAGDFASGRTIHALADTDAIKLKVWWEVQYEDSTPSKILIDANEIHLPVGQTAEIDLVSNDVIHSFWAPNFHGKKDLIPGHPTKTKLRADRAGTFGGQCAEYCGLEHAYMRFVVIAEPKEQFQQWLDAQRKPAPAPTGASEKRGKQVFEHTDCILCHTIAGTASKATIGPDLSHIASRTYIATMLPNNRGNLGGWILDPQSIKPGVHMPLNALEPADLNPLLDYLETLKWIAAAGTEEIERAPVEMDAEHLALHKTWCRAPGFLGWLTTTNHKDIGLRFIITAFVFFILGGILALMMRVQLAWPGNTFLGPDQYNQFFTTHGTTMMLLFAVPVMEGMGLYFVPLMLGTRNVSFPRLLNFGYYCYLFSGTALYIGLLVQMGPDQGWFSYTRLAGPEYGPGHRADLWSQIVTLVELSTLVGAVEIITTAFKQRAPGMSLNRIPLFVWSQVVTSFMVIFAMPAVMLCSTMLATDRLAHVNTHFFNQAEGGDALLWQHLFWFFAHPEVYIIFIPATGFISAILPAFTRRPTFGYTPLVLSMIAVAFIGFGVWVHHMFATPLPELGQGMFTASSLMITIPNGVQIFCWTATLWSGRISLKLPMIFVLGFFAIFLIGGLTGVILASVSLDLQVHDTFFVVAHLHYVLIGGAIFPLFGAMYFWFPKFTGRMLNETLGWWNFALLFIGFNLTFFPMHQLGLQGMPRRVYSYVAETGWGHLNFLATLGAMMMGIGVLVFLINVQWSRKRGRVAGNNPWAADTLEWTTTSPPPSYNFRHMPTVRGKSPAWENTPDTPIVVGLSTTDREVLVTTTHDAIPDHRYHMSSDSIWSFLMAIVAAYTLLGLVFHPVSIPLGAIGTLVVLFAWFRPPHETKPIHHPHERKIKHWEQEGPTHD